MPEMPTEPYYFDLNERQRKLLEYLKTYGSIRNRDKDGHASIDIASVGIRGE